MQNEGPKQPPKAKDDSLQSPHPPKQVEAPEVQENDVVETENTHQQDQLEKRSEIKGTTDKVQDHDWNNGRPEVTPDNEEVLEAHKTPEVKNDESLRKNKGNKDGEKVMEASEEVETGQNSG